MESIEKCFICQSNVIQCNKCNCDQIYYCDTCFFKYTFQHDKSFYCSNCVMPLLNELVKFNKCCLTDKQHRQSLIDKVKHSFITDINHMVNSNSSIYETDHLGLFDLYSTFAKTNRESYGLGGFNTIVIGFREYLQTISMDYKLGNVILLTCQSGLDLSHRLLTKILSTPQIPNSLPLLLGIVSGNESYSRIPR